MPHSVITIGFLDHVSPEELLHYRLENKEFFKPFSPTYPEDFFTVNGQTRWLRDVNETKFLGSGFTFGIFLLNDTNPIEETLIGVMSIFPIFRGSFQNAFISYELAEKYNGKGFTTTALSMVCDFAFQTLKLHRVELAILPTNKASIQVAEKNNFQKIGISQSYTEVAGTWREHVLYEKINESWV